MERASPVLIERIAKALAARAAPRSSADLAREFLGLGIVDETIADKLLSPVFSADPRFVHGPAGWTVSAVPGGGNLPGPDAIELAAPFVAVFAPPGAAFAALHEGPGGPVGAGHDAAARYAVAPGGAAEVRRAAAITGRRLPERAVPLGAFARRLRGYRGAADPLRIAESLRVPHLEEETTPDSHARLIAALWERWRDELALEEVASLDGLDALLEERLEAAEFRGKEFDHGTLAALPEGPGVYAFEDAAGKTLYVGQSSSLRARVGSYFAGPPRDAKDRAIRAGARRLATHSVDTPPDALILESRWIRRLAPELNTRRGAGFVPAPDGVLVVPAGPREGMPDAVLFAVAGGALRERVALRAGPKRARTAAVRAAEAIFAAWGDAPAAARAEASLVATWHRVRPELPLVTAERAGTAGAAAELLLGAARSLAEGG
jgi:hypothetical protein